MSMCMHGGGYGHVDMGILIEANTVYPSVALLWGNETEFVPPAPVIQTLMSEHHPAALNQLSPHLPSLALFVCAQIWNSWKEAGGKLFPNVSMETASSPAGSPKGTSCGCL